MSYKTYCIIRPLLLEPQIRQSGENLRETAEARRTSAESIRETTAITRRTLEASLSQVEGRLHGLEERMAQFAAEMRQSLEVIRRTVPQCSEPETVEARYTSAQRLRDRAQQMFKDAQEVRRRNGHRDV